MYILVPSVHLVTPKTENVKSFINLDLFMYVLCRTVKPNAQDRMMFIHTEGQTTFCDGDISGHVCIQYTA